MVLGRLAPQPNRGWGGRNPPPMSAPAPPTLAETPGQYFKNYFAVTYYGKIVSHAEPSLIPVFL